MLFTGIISNISLLIVLTYIYSFIYQKKSKIKPKLQKFLTGILFGSIAIAGMMMPLNFAPGIIFDGRSIILSIGALFGGVPVAIISTIMTIIYRSIIGGAGTYVGIGVATTSAVIGLIYRYIYSYQKARKTIYLYFLGLVVHICMMLWMLLLPGKSSFDVIRQLSLLILFVYPLATIIVAKLLIDRENSADTRLRLISSAKKFKSVFEASNVGKSITQLDGKIYVNQAFCDMLGYSEKELQNKKWQDITPSEDIQSIQDRLKLLISGELDSLRFDKRYIHKNQSLIWADVSVHLFRDNDHNPLHFFTTIIDITERKRTVEELRKTSEYLNNLIDYANTPIITWDTSRKISRFNHAFERLTGFKAEEVIGKNLEILFPTEDISASLKKVTAATAGELWETVEIRIQTIDKQIKTALWNSANIYAEDGVSLMSTIAQGQDITELKESEALFRSMFKNNYAVMLLIDPDSGAIIDANPAACRYYGYSKKEILKLKIENINTLPPGQIKEEMKLAKANQRYHFALKHRLANGSVRDVEVFSGSVKLKQNEVLYSIIFDVTERNIAVRELKDIKTQLESAVTQRTAEISKQLQKLDKSEKAMLYMVEDLNTLTASLDEEKRKLLISNQELEAFSYSVSHDLRAPLRAIDGFSNFLLEDYADKLDEEGKRLLDVIRYNATKMDRLILDLLSLSRISRTDMNLTLVEMKDTVKSIYEDIASEIEINSFDFILNDIPPVYCDPTLIKQVWQNLISNALKYSAKSDHKVIEISANQEDKSITYCIRDRGAGFQNEYVDKLFGVFQRLHTEKEFHGTGVGLAIVKRIIQRHGGKVWADGVVDEGASFYFTLPDID